MGDEQKSSSSLTWLTAISSLSLGVVIAWAAFNHFLKSDSDNDLFLRDTLINELKASTAATAKSAASSESLAKSISRFAEEMDDLTDTSREVVNRFDRIIANEWNRGTAVQPTSHPVRQEEGVH